jgi:methylated-DNA-[protein]-cysteine S-methyltransferase
MITQVSFTRFTSSIGTISIYGSTAGIARVSLEEPPQALQRDEGNSQVLLEARRQILQYLEGDRVAFDLFLDWKSIYHFQKDVLQLTLNIPFGEVRTYGQLAAQLHKPGAARAVGAALARNPLPILIPCHRVVASNGHLTGYLGGKGIATKQWLLEREGHRVVGQKLG